MELFAKALKRLRAYGQLASAVQVTVRYRKVKGVSGAGLSFSTQDGIWTRRSSKHLHPNDDLTWLKVVRPILAAIPDLSPAVAPLYVGITFLGLLAYQDRTLSLFEDTEEQMRLATVVDGLNRKFGGPVVGLGEKKPQYMPLRIPFGTPDSAER